MFTKPTDSLAALAHFANLSGVALYDDDEGAFLRDDGETLEVGWTDDQLWVGERPFTPSEGYTHVKAWLQGEGAPQDSCQPEPEEPEGEGEEGPCSLERMLYVAYCAITGDGVDSTHNRQGRFDVNRLVGLL